MTPEQQFLASLLRKQQLAQEFSHAQQAQRPGMQAYAQNAINQIYDDASGILGTKIPGSQYANQLAGLLVPGGQAIMPKGQTSIGGLLETLPVTGDMADAWYLGEGIRERDRVKSGMALSALALPAIGMGALYGVQKRMNPNGAQLSGMAASPMASGQRGIFGGVNAKTADMDMLDIAKAAEKQGMSKQQIFDATGWFKGPDDKWRFEIDDSQAFMHGLDKTRKGTPISYQMGDLTWKQDRSAVPFNELVTHDGLLGAYPEVSHIDYGTAIKGTRGQYDSSIGGGHIRLNPEMTAKEASSTNLHELQHAIQGREGFAGGGSPEDFSRTQSDALVKVVNKFDDAINTPFADMAMEASGDFKRLKELRYRFPDEYKKLSDALIELNANNIHEARIKVEHLWRQADNIRPETKYKHLAGETEARNVQTRMGLLGDDRRMLAPWLTEDVPIDQQIVRYDD